MSTSALLTGLAGLVQSAGIGVYDPDRIYTAQDTAVAITIGTVPQDPPQLVTLAHYAVRDDARLNDSTLGVQIRTRGDEDPGTVQDRNDALFDLLQGVHDVTVGGVAVVLIARQSSLPLGQDGNRRWEYSSNYYVQVAWPTRHRTD